MVTLKFKYIVFDKDRHGNIRYYFRRNGRKIRLPGLPGSDEFMAVYHAAMKGEIAQKTAGKAVSPDSFAGLCERFYRSQTFKKLTPRSQRVRQLILDRFCAKHGHLPYKFMERRHVREFRDQLADKPGSATNLIKALRHVFTFAVDDELIDANPAIDVSYLRKGGTGFHSWTIDEIRQYEARHPIGGKARLAMALLFYTGQRRSDVVRFGRQMIREGKLHFTQVKTGRKMVIPVIAQLQKIIDATPSAGLSLLETHFGRPYTSNGFGNAFRQWCSEAGLPQCSAHGLRKALGARLAEAGATTKQIQDSLGHLTLSESARYTAAADQEINAGAALRLFENELTANKEREAKKA